MSRIIEVATALPQFSHLQESTSDFYASTTEDTTIRRKIGMMARRSGISTRHSVIPDFSPGERWLFKNGAAPGVTERMDIFRREATALSEKAVLNLSRFANLKDRITHLITVTCTGLSAPGIDILLSSRLGLKASIRRSAVNFMGCNAAVLALLQAADICAGNGSSLVLVVCTELCTLHFQTSYSDDYMMSNLLFGDDSAAVLVGGEKSFGDEPLTIRSFHSCILREGENDMAWTVSETGFVMNLSSYVSRLLNGNIKRLLHDNGIDPASVHRWAVHPGGVRILQDFEKALDLRHSDLEHSYNVLREAGNMSSATILFVLQRVIAAMKAGENVYAAAFGPGLTIESMVLQHA